MMKNKISQLLKSLNISGYELAKATGISKNTVYLLSNNPDQYPMADVVDRILETYPDVTLLDIIEHVRTKST